MYSAEEQHIEKYECLLYKPVCYDNFQQMAVESLLRRGHNHSPRGFIRMDKYGSNRQCHGGIGIAAAKIEKRFSLS